MAAQTKDLWSLTGGNNPQVDPTDLSAAIEDQVVRQDLDYRSRVLIRDSIKALRHYWGSEKVSQWLATSPMGAKIDTICQGPWDDDRGFSSLMSRVVDVTKPETIKQFLRELSLHVHRPLRLEIGGSASLILQCELNRKTEDIDVVDEVPAEIRSQHKLIEELAVRYGLKPTHFQQHYLPSGWQSRLHYFETYGEVRIYLVDPYDVILSKLFSSRTKDLDDVRAVLPQLEKETLVRKLKDTAQSMLAAADMRPHAEKNWFILFGEALPA
jgi:hypothetical protein